MRIPLNLTFIRSAFHLVSRKPFTQPIRKLAYRREGTLVTMKIDSPYFRGLFTPELKELVSIFDRHGYELRIAGGAVRDLLMGINPADIDLATTATPDQMKKVFESENIRMINNKGEKHGTITARINDQENFEVTTLRVDVVTDGRHAEVEFTCDWQLDANRRDLTINAMFLGFDGTLYDYFHGKEDLDQRKVKFVGDPEARIQEDFLRILRYFRFYGRISTGPGYHDSETLEAIRRNAHGLAGISGERIWMELKKIILGNYSGHLVETMLSLGMGPFIGLPENSNVKEFLKVCQLSEGLSPLPMTRLSALLETEKQVYDVQQRLKISTDELKLAIFIVEFRSEEFGDSPFKQLTGWIVDNANKDKKLKERILELIKYKGEETLLQSVTEWSPPVLPVTGHDLFERQIPKGPIFSKTLTELRAMWKQSDYRMTKAELLEKLDKMKEEMEL